MPLPLAFNRAGDEQIASDFSELAISEWPGTIKFFRGQASNEAFGVLSSEQCWSQVQSDPVHQSLLERRRIDRTASLQQHRGQAFFS